MKLMQEEQQACQHVEQSSICKAPAQRNENHQSPKWILVGQTTTKQLDTIWSSMTQGTSDVSTLYLYIDKITYWRLHAHLIHSTYYSITSIKTTPQQITLCFGVLLPFIQVMNAQRKIKEHRHTFRSAVKRSAECLRCSGTKQRSRMSSWDIAAPRQFSWPQGT